MPCSSANRTAPSPTNSECSPSSRIASASSTALPTGGQAPTAPNRRSPVITAASSSTVPSRVSVDPSPALKAGSSSSTFTAATTAASAPRERTSVPARAARSHPAIPCGKRASSHAPAPPWTRTIGSGISTRA